MTAILSDIESYLLDERLGKHPDWRKGTQYGTMIWTSDRLKPYHWEYMDGLKPTLPVDGFPGGALLYHGSPDNIKGYIFTNDAAREAAEGHPEHILAGGHSHQTRMFRLGRQMVMDVGSVGLALDGVGGVAAYALLNEEESCPAHSIVFRSVAYDVDAAVDSLMKSGLAEWSPGITRSVVAELKTGRHYMAGLVAYAMCYAEKQLGYKPGTIPPEIWREAEASWDVSEWMPGRGQ